MKLEAVAEIPFSRERVFAVYRDKLPELVPYLPNVRGIAVTSRKEEGSRLLLVNHWKGGGDIPAAARSVLSEKVLEWDDHATWDNAAWTTDWKIVSRAFPEGLRASGR